MELAIRDPLASDWERIAAYWRAQTGADLERMGIDPAKVPELLTTASLRSTPDSRVLVWLHEGLPIGHVSLRKIRLGEEAEIHLHLWSDSLRRRGLGQALFRLSLRTAFERLQLRRIICEPCAGNPAPNRLLARLGFRPARTYRAVPSPISLEAEVNRYEIHPDEIK